MNDAATRKVQGLVTALKAQHEKTSALIDEITEVLGGGPGIAATMKAFEATFDVVWCARYAPGEHGRYIWRYAADRPNLKRLLRSLSVEVLQLRAHQYLQSDDPFLVRNRHPFGLFVTGINSFAPAAPHATELDREPPAADCQHRPRCGSDHEHTRRTQAALRQGGSR